jgi:hypothetical protein
MVMYTVCKSLNNRAYTGQVGSPWSCLEVIRGQYLNLKVIFLVNSSDCFLFAYFSLETGVKYKLHLFESSFVLQLFISIIYCSRGFYFLLWLQRNYPSPMPSSVEPPEDSIATLVSMGFDRNSARQALVQARNDVNVATNILLEAQAH